MAARSRGTRVKNKPSVSLDKVRLQFCCLSLHQLLQHDLVPHKSDNIQLLFNPILSLHDSSSSLGSTSKAEEKLIDEVSEVSLFEWLPANYVALGLVQIALILLRFCEIFLRFFVSSGKEIGEEHCGVVVITERHKDGGCYELETVQ